MPEITEISEVWLKTGEYAEILRLDGVYRRRLYVLGPRNADFLEPADWVIAVGKITNKRGNTHFEPEDFEV